MRLIRRKQKRVYADGRVAAALAIGALIGAGAALLFAPTSGASLRSGIGESVDSLGNAVNTRYRRLADRAVAKFERANTAAGHAVAAVEQGARHFAKVASRA